VTSRLSPAAQVQAALGRLAATTRSLRAEPWGERSDVEAQAALDVVHAAHRLLRSLTKDTP